jgi:hypothetical protein
MNQIGRYRAFTIDSNGCESDFGNSLYMEAVQVIKPQIAYPSGTNLPLTVCENDDVNLQLNNWIAYSNLSTVTDYVFSWYRVESAGDVFLGTSNSPIKQVNVGENTTGVLSFDAKFYVVAEHVLMGACAMTSDTFNIDVRNTPSAPVVSAYPTDTICLGEDIDLVALSSDALIPNPNYKWYYVNPDGTLNSQVGIGDTLTRAPSVGGTYTFAAVAENSGCPGPATTIDFFVRDLTPPILEPVTAWSGGVFNVCKDSTIDLRVSTPMLNGATYELYRKDLISGNFNPYPTQSNVLKFIYDSSVPNSNVFPDVEEGDERMANYLIDMYLGKADGRSIGNKKNVIKFTAQFRKMLSLSLYEMYWLCDLFISETKYTLVLEKIFFDSNKHRYGEFKNHLEDSKLYQFFE